MTAFLPAFLKRRVIAPTPLPRTLDLGGHAVPLTFREHPTARRLIMRVTPEGGVVVTMPRRTARKTVLEFVERHKGWAQSRLAERPTTPAIRNGAILPFRGGTLTIIHAPGLRASKVEHNADGATLLHVGGDARFMARRVKDFLVREARRDLTEAVERHAQAVGLKPRAITLKDTVSRWGSCTHDRRLAFSFRIVMAPPTILNYLAAHEVAHFVHMNHSEAFWALCRQLCTDTDECRKWLRREGVALQAIAFENRA